MLRGASQSTPPNRTVASGAKAVSSWASGQRASATKTIETAAEPQRVCSERWGLWKAVYGGGQVTERCCEVVIRCVE